MIDPQKPSMAFAFNVTGKAWFFCYSRILKDSPGSCREGWLLEAPSSLKEVRQANEMSL